MRAYDIEEKMRQVFQPRSVRDVISGEQHSVRMVREVQNNDSLIVRCTK